jgi:hypothetical protein
MVDKRVLIGVFSILLISISVSYAGVNPFKKSKNYNFGADVAWYEHNGVAVKSGSVRDGADTNYYHLNIDKDQLLLRLGRNDPSGELENTRLLNGLSISDIRVDGRRLPVFNWCLENQQSPGNKLKQNAIVANDICINAGGGGDIIINLDERSHNILKSARQLEFVVEPYGRPVKLNYSMSGYALVMAKINKPAPPPVVVKPAPKPAVVTAKPGAKPKAKPRPKPVKRCKARPPADFKTIVAQISYPCKDGVKKSKAEKKISAAVNQEKKKRSAELQVVKKEKQSKQKTLEDQKRESEWDDKQSTLWVSRCKRHWAKNSSPCYCEKYLSQAPDGVKNTCNK